MRSLLRRVDFQFCCVQTALAGQNWLSVEHLLVLQCISVVIQRIYLSLHASMYMFFSPARMVLPVCACQLQIVYCGDSTCWCGCMLVGDSRCSAVFEVCRFARCFVREPP